MEIGQLEARPDRHLNNLAILPISFLSEQGDRLAELCNQTASGDNYRDLFVSSIWVYPMHAYMTLVREKMGAAVAEAVWSHQRGMLDEAGTGAGDAMESAFMLIDRALDLDDFRMDGLDAPNYVLPEARIALALLLGMPESPDYSGRISVHPGRPRTMCTKVEECLAHCLLRARVELLAACSDLFENNYTGRINSNA